MNAFPLLFLAALALIFGCSTDTAFTFTDERDNKTYRAVKIGKQVWMAENLNYEAESSKCYDNDPANCEKYGRLYDWETAMKACPDGWHLPNNKEWNVLIDFVGGDEVAGKKLKAANSWNDNDGKSGNGKDKFGLAALPGGGGYSDGSFLYVGYRGYWWSATEGSAYNAYSRYMYYNVEDALRYSNYKSYLLSLRCVRD